MSGPRVSYSTKDLSHHPDVRSMEHFLGFLFEILIPAVKKTKNKIICHLKQQKTK